MITETIPSTLMVELGQASTSKKEFLVRTERIIPWSEWLGIIMPRYYYKGER